MSPCAVGRCVRGCMVRIGVSMCCREMGMHGEQGWVEYWAKVFEYEYEYC